MLAVNVFAQSPPPPFVIGFHGFAPEWHPTDFNLHYIRGYISNPMTEEERRNFVGDTIFARVRELGGTLISYNVDPAFVIPSPNVTHQLGDVAQPPAHPRPLDMAVLDLGLDTYLKGERIMFHPEVEADPISGLEEDFKLRGTYTPVNDDDFNRIPYSNLNLSAPLPSSTRNSMPSAWNRARG